LTSEDEFHDFGAASKGSSFVETWSVIYVNGEGEKLGAGIRDKRPSQIIMIS
jgi:hypothetical protein